MIDEIHDLNNSGFEDLLDEYLYTLNVERLWKTCDIPDVQKMDHLVLLKSVLRNIKDALRRAAVREAAVGTIRKHWIWDWDGHEDFPRMEYDEESMKEDVKYHLVPEEDA